MLCACVALATGVARADVPWAAVVDEVSTVTVAEGVTLGKNALAALSDDVLVTVTSTVGSLRGALGAPVAPSGAVSAEFDAVQIVDGKAHLGVSVYTNSEVKATDEGWGVATNGVIEVPAEGKSGFFYLKSKPAVLSDLKEPPHTTVR